MPLSIILQSFFFKLFRNCGIFICFLCCHINHFFQNTVLIFVCANSLTFALQFQNNILSIRIKVKQSMLYIFSLDDFNRLIRPWLSLEVSNIKWLPSSFLKWPCVVDLASITLPLRFNSNFLLKFKHIMFLNSVLQ